MSSTSTQAPPRSSAPPDERALTSSIERLRAEHDASDNAAVQAMLLHEIGVLEERFGDEAAAARDHLAAVNGDPEFQEPLERLVAIIERRQSYKNLGKVLERLVRVADTATERARALMDQAAFLADQQADLDGARIALLDAAEQTPDDPSIWLAAEFLAVRLGDGELLQRALATRAGLTQNLTLRGLLLNGYAFWKMGQIAAYAAVAAFVGAGLLLLLAGLGLLHLRRTDPSAEVLPHLGDPSPAPARQ